MRQDFTHTWYEILDKLEGVQAAGKNSYRAHCPAHQGDSKNFYISQGETGILMYCHAGCTLNEICLSLAVEPQDLFFEKKEFVRTDNWKYWKEQGPIDKEIVWLFETWRAEKTYQWTGKDEEDYISAKERLVKHKNKRSEAAGVESSD